MWGRTSICIGLVAAPLMVGFASMGFAQDGEEALAAEPVVVTATRTEQEISDVTGSITVIEQDDIQLGRQTLGMSEPLRGVPGVYVQNQGNFAGDLRLSIRGFGARGRFGIQGIRVLVDGIPETTADGQSNVDSIEMSAMERIEVLRGPSA
ncbi:MAG: TonB-dependent receptor plug domain-containing protein, partial [bacterium]